MDPRVQIYGIRHHGPGSAASLLDALVGAPPSVVLVELPKDATPALSYANAAGMRPPLALLLHDAKEPARSSFYPFAEFSPEWQALLHAGRCGIPVRAIDLPAGVWFRERAEAEGQVAETGADEIDASEHDEDSVHIDPLDRLAELAGHSDGESWWDAVVERGAHAPEVFAAIGDAMGALREEVERVAGRRPRDNDRELRREAHMRQEIRTALAEFAGPVAVVVGAWHVPALRAAHTVAADRALLAGSRPLRIEATWVPWTDARLAIGSGYRAGISAPGWYRHVWNHGRSALHRAAIDGANREHALQRGTSMWMSLACRTLRANGLPASTAAAVDAARLAHALSSLRGHPIPGLAEMDDACLAALCHGERAPLALLTRQLAIGTSIGAIDESVPQMPLAADLAREQKRLRLAPEALERELALDLRTENGLARSTLLHRLLLIEVPWGKLVSANAGRGTSREVWKLAWEPELSVRLAEALKYGTTVEHAARGAALARERAARGVGELGALVQQCLLADLREAALSAIARLQATASHSTDVVSTIDAIGPLIDVLRYGTARAIPVEPLRELIGALCAQVHASLPHACRGIDVDLARELAQRVRAFDAALRVESDEHEAQTWTEVLALVVRDHATAPHVAGAGARLLADCSAWDADTTALAMSRALSPAAGVAEAGAWLEGFLGANAAVLLHESELLARVDAWVSAQGGEDFEAMLPVLRRTFSAFDASERRHVLVALGRTQVASHTPTANTRAFEPTYLAALPRLCAILGLEPVETP